MQPRGVTLLVTVLLLVLLITVVAELAMLTSVDSIRVWGRANTLRHRLAVDSVLQLVRARLASGDHRLQDDLDRLGRVTLETTLGRCRVRCAVGDDAAKLDVAAFDQRSQRRLLTRKLTALARVYDLPRARVKLRPLGVTPEDDQRRYRWFDQLFADPPPAAFLRVASDGDGILASAPVWSDVLTLFGSGRIDVRRVAPEVLEVALADIERGLAQSILSARHQAEPSQNFLPEAVARLDASVRHRVAERLAFDLHRYALTIETAIGGDRRCWYVVATMDGDTIETHYRGQIQW